MEHGNQDSCLQLSVELYGGKEVMFVVYCITKNYNYSLSFSILNLFIP